MIFVIGIRIVFWLHARMTRDLVLGGVENERVSIRGCEAHSHTCRRSRVSMFS